VGANKSTNAAHWHGRTAPETDRVKNSNG